MCLILGVSRDIQPMSPPALAIMWRFEQPIDDAGIRLRRFIFQKRINFFRSGRKSNHIEVDTANQLAAICGWAGLESGRFEFGKDEVIQVALRPIHLSDCGNR